jgi:hypothetical protein
MTPLTRFTQYGQVFDGAVTISLIGWNASIQNGQNSQIMDGLANVIDYGARHLNTTKQ